MAGCELKNTQWFRDYGGGNEWEWLFKETTFLAGAKGLLNPITGSWRVEHGFLQIADDACLDSSEMPIVGTYLYKVVGDQLSLTAYADACYSRATSIPGQWTRA